MSLDFGWGPNGSVNFLKGEFSHIKNYHTYIYIYSIKHNDYFLVVVLATDRLECNLSVWKTRGLSQILWRDRFVNFLREYYTHMWLPFVLTFGTVLLVALLLPRLCSTLIPPSTHSAISWGGMEWGTASKQSLSTALRHVSTLVQCRANIPELACLSKKRSLAGQTHIQL